MTSTPPVPDRVPPPLNASTTSTATFDIDDSLPSPSTVDGRHVSSSVLQRSALGVASTSAQVTPAHVPRRVSNIRPSFSTFRRVSRPANFDDDGETPRLPTLVPGIRPAYSTPLPVLPMLVLCIAMISELLSANLAQPFMLKMVEGFFIAAGNTPTNEMEAQVGLWTGNLVSVFYITQFFTSLLWSSIADRHGRRAVLVASMTGSGLALLMFGTSTSLPEAICVRLIQGIFGGAIGVFRGSIRDITDETNATRAYALLGFCWGLGGVIGPIIGGVFENPAKNHPDTIFGRIEVFKRLPYFLPTLLGGAIMFIGAIMACFLSWDGGVRGGSRIQLEVEKDEPLAPTRVDALSPPNAQQHRPSTASSMRARPARIFSPAQPEEDGAGMSSSMRLRRESLASLGTAYGYGGIRSKHPTLAARRAIAAARRASAADRRRAGEETEEDDPRKVSFATKLFLANEDNTFNINDLWLSAAVAQDTAVFDDDDEYDEDIDVGESNFDMDDRVSLAPTEDDAAGTPTPGSPSSPRRGLPFTRTMESVRSGRSRVVSSASEIHRLIRRQSVVSRGSRRHSVSSNVVPSIFSNTGLQSTPYDVDDEGTSSADPFGTPAAPGRRMTNAPAPLSAIQEANVAGSSPSSSTGTSVEKPTESRWKMLPLLLICQYGLLSCHDSTHGQIFLSFIITPFQSGGVGISPAHYSVFVAIMCIGQLVYQFYLFPRLGPPLGRFSHLQMFRLGSALYVPGYLLVPVLHLFASSEKSGGVVVMTLMSLISAIRYCGGTFAYTSIMILINAMTPPHLVGLANGLAQSTVSCARFFGPALGGAIWSASINGNPGGYARGFVTVACFALVQVLGTFFIH